MKQDLFKTWLKDSVENHEYISERGERKSPKPQKRF